MPCFTRFMSQLTTLRPSIASTCAAEKGEIPSPAFRVYYSDEILTTHAGFGRVAHIPCIFDGTHRYHRTASRYLIDRALRAWSPTGSRLGRVGRPGKATVRNWATWLVNFLEWATVRKVDLTKCHYTSDILEGYQEEMLQGVWSSKGRLSPNTVNPRVTQATDFLCWMAEKKLRPEFIVPMKEVSTRVKSSYHIHGVKLIKYKTREGRASTEKADKRRLRMPATKPVKQWLDSVEKKHGQAKRLMCEGILETAVRRAEMANWRVETLPEDPRTWNIPNPTAPKHEQFVLVTIKYGTKGPTYGYDHGDKIGPKRTIRVPLRFAEKIHTYRRQRVDALKIWVSAAHTLAEKKKRIEDSVHLFLDSRTGARIDGRALYRAWKDADLPYAQWRPHLGRDYWACTTLLRELLKHDHMRKVLSSSEQGVAAALLESSAMSAVRLIIMPQLGHASEETSLIYLQWAADYFGVSLSILYDADDDEPTH